MKKLVRLMKNISSEIAFRAMHFGKSREEYMNDFEEHIIDRVNEDFYKNPENSIEALRDIFTAYLDGEVSCEIQDEMDNLASLVAQPNKSYLKGLSLWKIAQFADRHAIEMIANREIHTARKILFPDDEGL